METWAGKVVVHVPGAGWGKHSFQTLEEPQKKLIAHSHPTLVSLPELSLPTSSVGFDVAAPEAFRASYWAGWALCQFHPTRAQARFDARVQRTPGQGNLQQGGGLEGESSHLRAMIPQERLPLPQDPSSVPSHLGIFSHAAHVPFLWMVRQW